MINKFFSYGTLLPELTNYRLVQQFKHSIDYGYVTGRLFWVPNFEFPVLVDTKKDAYDIWGAIYSFNNNEILRVISCFDALEGYYEHIETACFYNRIKVKVVGLVNEEFDAYTYICNPELAETFSDSAEEIEHGNFYRAVKEQQNGKL